MAIGLLTPRETVRRPSMGEFSPVPDQHLEEDLMMEFEQALTIEPIKSEDDSDHPRLAARRKGKQPIRPTLSVPTSKAKPRLQSPQRYDNKRLRAPPSIQIEINSSDGDDEDDIADDTASLQADEQAVSVSDYGGIIWPAGVGIGPKSDEVDMKDEHPSAADTPFPELDSVLSPSTVCADRIVPVCPGPFRMTPSYRLGSPILVRGTLLRGAVDGGILGRAGLGDGWGIGREGKATAATATATAAISTTVAGSSTDEPSPAGTVKKSRILKLSLKKAPAVPKPHVPPAAPSVPMKQERDLQQLIVNGELISLSDDSDDDMDVDVDVGAPALFRVQPSPQRPDGLSTRESIQSLGVPPPALNIPNVMLRFSRAHIQKAFGGRPRGTVTIVNSNAGRIFYVKQFLCINEKLNPYYPSHAGAHGAMFIFRTGVVPLNTEWAVFCSRRRIGPGPQETFEYVGNYVVRDVNDMPYDEWVGSSVKFKDGWYVDPRSSQGRLSDVRCCRAGHVARQAKSPKGWASQNLASRRLVRSAGGITPEQVRRWFDAAGVSLMQRNEWFGLADVYSLPTWDTIRMPVWGGEFWNSRSIRAVCLFLS